MDEFSDENQGETNLSIYMAVDRSKLHPEPKRTDGALSVQQRVNRKIFRVSASVGAIAAALTILVYLAQAYPSLRRWQAVNLRTLSQIDCMAATCDTSRFTTDWESGSPDYILDTQTRYFINVPEPSATGPAHFNLLDYSDTAFIRRFRKPTSYTAPDGEVWRLYSRDASSGHNQFEIIVGYAEKAPWKMIESPASMMGTVDEALRHEADKIAAALAADAGGLKIKNRPSANADGFEVVDGSTGQVLDWGPWLPVFLPKDVPLLSQGRQLYVEGNDLYMVQTDISGRLMATSLVPVGNLSWLALMTLVASVGTFFLSRSLSRRYLRRYFAVTNGRVPNLEEALHTGEGQNIEFKRSLSSDEGKVNRAEDELLKSIAAFANTNDGVIFLGVDDTGHLKGLGLNFKEKDNLERKIHQLARTRISPTPPLQVTFEEIRGLTVANIAVSRGEAVAHLLGGAIYVRQGSADVQAQSEDLRRLVTEYAT